MANYHYDEAGNMAAYFLLSFLALVLIPMTLSSLSGRKKSQRPVVCQCQPCIEQRKQVGKAEGASLLNPKLARRTMFLIGGWSLFAFVSYRVANAKIDNKVYNPFEILGLNTGVSEKEIKSHYKKLSKMYHPDKVKATANETIEFIQERFVDLTKAYKSLTDVTIRENLEKYGHPDGRQETTMGIALPKWIVEGRNNIWVLGFYGIVFGGALPALVGRWWFGNQSRTKDGINNKSAAAFFRGVKEESSMEELVGTLGKAYTWELPSGVKAKSQDAQLDELEKQILERAGPKWTEVKRLSASDEDGTMQNRRKALILIYAHLLRLDMPSSSLRKDQNRILLQLPLLLNAFLNITISRNWLAPSLEVMRLHSYLFQGLLPTGSESQRFAQLPGIASTKDAKSLAPEAKDFPDVVAALQGASDARAADAAKAVERWGRLELVSAQFKVIGERIVTPSAIIYLVLKLRLSPPSLSGLSGDIKNESSDSDVEKKKRLVKANAEKDYQFLTSRKEAEDLVSAEDTLGDAHAPLWPATRKPTFWIVLADVKQNRLVVPPTRISEVPYSSTRGQEADRDYRSYKIQFQGPNTVGVCNWKMFIISDTFVGEEVVRDMTLRIDDVSALADDEQGVEDEISDPEEDSIAGQMAMMKGGKVKSISTHEESDEESDEDESTTDGDESDDSDSDSDSD